MVVKKLLLVEDNIVNTEIVTNLLDDLEIEYDVAVNGQEAVRACIREGKGFYRLILMDVHMPVLNGYEASRILKEEIGVTAPIILCTATVFSDDVYSKYGKYVDGMIQKPLEIDKFSKIIKSYFYIGRPKSSL